MGIVSNYLKKGRQGLKQAPRVLVISAVALVAVVAVAIADDISNNEDASIDAALETMSLTAGGATDTTTLSVTPTGTGGSPADGKSGCNLTGGSILTIAVASSNPAVATATLNDGNPLTLNDATFTSCSDTKTVTVTPLTAGTTNITVSQVANNTRGTFNFAPAAFTVNVGSADSTKPVITASATAGGNPYTAGTWTNQDVIVSFTCTDEVGGSGIKTNTVAGDTVSSETSNGSVTNTGTCEDNAGNVADAVTFSPIQIDKTKPVITASATSDGNPYTGGTWTNDDVVVSFSCADSGGSGIDTNTVAGETVSNETTDTDVTNSGTCTDDAGNTADSATFNDIQIDKTAPTYECDPEAADEDWHADNVSFACTASDGTGWSGLADSANDAAFTLSTSVADGVANANASTNSNSIADNAGNSVTAGPISGNMIDMEDPDVACNTPAPAFVVGQTTPPPNVTGTADDNDGSGLASSVTSVAADVSSITTTTPRTVTLSAEDNVGNKTEVLCSYTVTFNKKGFFSPISMSAVNVTKPGSTVPIKFSLDGDPVPNSNTPGHVGNPTEFIGSSIIASCQGATDELTSYELLADTPSAAGSLKYDPTADQWIYTWKTGTGSDWSNRCRQLVVKFVDGTYLRANFQFKK